jgi:hypothetical protein
MVFSFKDFDITQGQTFEDWENEKLLHLMLERLKEYSKRTIPEAEKGDLHPYKEYPPDSHFKCPLYIDKNSKWASFHIRGKECVAGYKIDNIFHVVFLDKEHKFWPSEKKHT